MFITIFVIHNCQQTSNMFNRALLIQFRDSDFKLYLCNQRRKCLIRYRYRLHVDPLSYDCTMDMYCMCDFSSPTGTDSRYCTLMVVATITYIHSPHALNLSQIIRTEFPSYGLWLGNFFLFMLIKEGAYVPEMTWGNLILLKKRLLKSRTPRSKAGRNERRRSHYVMPNSHDHELLTEFI